MQQKILLVDDREDNLLSVQSILEPGGYYFVKAKSGREALKILLSQFDFALILMDVNMPNLNGFETASLIYEREKLRNIPIIFITAHDDDDRNMFKGYRAGAVDYIAKPVNPELLRAKVAVFTELYAKTQQLQVQEQRLKTVNTNLENEIKERKHSEKRVNELNRQLIENINSLESANKELDRFAFMASHDLQEPLRKIRTFCDLLATSEQVKDFNEETSLYISRIENAAGKMQRLIKDILTFSRVSEDNDEFAETDLNKVIQEILDEHKPEIDDKKALVDVKSIPSIITKPGLMYPLFSNLISNALKYSKNQEPVRISIWSEICVTDKKNEPLDINNKYCRISVQDNGIGFEQKYAEQVFEMFKRLHAKKEYEGSGIGLTLCKKIVERHNGFIAVRSEVGVGSIFMVTLPVRQVLQGENQSKGKIAKSNVF
ncbi:MAG: response regulator [Chitinophagaceae bacterium]